VLHIDLPISLGLIAAYAGSLTAWRNGAADFVYFDFISVFTFLMLAGRWTQEAAVAANRNRLLDGQFTVPHPGRGERFRVTPGQVVPVKSILLSPAATLGMEWISGESEARTARRGQLVPGGAVSLSREPIELEAAESWHESMLARLLDTAPRTDRRQRGLEQFIRVYLIVVLAIATAAFAGWLWHGADTLRALQVLTSILVVSCPCATGVALPLAEDLATARVRRAGVLIRDPGVWSRLPRVDTIVFDKTGTLTLETIALLNPGALERLTPGERSILLTMVEDNLHPVASCLREHLLAADARARGHSGAGSKSAPDGPGDAQWSRPVRPPGPVSNRPSIGTREVVGSGIEAERDGCVYRLGRPGWAGEGEGDCIFSRDGKMLASFRFGDELREDAAAEFRALRANGRSLHILSGDRPDKVTAIASSLGLPPDHAHGAQSPDDKAAWLRAHGPQRTLMIGDGANDSLAFNESLCTGTPAIDRGLLERKADFYFLGRGLGGIRALFDIAMRKHAAVRAVIAFAIAYNVAAIALSIAGRMSPLLAAILMPLSGLTTVAIVLGMLAAKKR
jgi:Cu2+-exporting ATPase